jgi:hypothetical protein
LSGYEAISWILRDERAPVATGYAAISIDLIQTLYEIQQLLDASRPLHVHAGFCVDYVAVVGA